MQCVVWSQEGTQSAAGVFCLEWLVNDCLVGRDTEGNIYLDPAIFCELDTMIRYKLMDLAVLVAFALGVADQDDHLRGYGLVEFRPGLVYE